MEMGETMVGMPVMEKATLLVRVRGTSPLISHRFGEVAKAPMRDKQQGKAKAKKEPKVPEILWEDALHKLPDKEGIGFPAVGFKKSIVGGARFCESLPMTILQAAIRVHGMHNGLVEIEQLGGPWEGKEDIVRIDGGRLPDLRYRPYISSGWEAELKITFPSRIVSADQVLQLIMMGGEFQGIGDWRPQKGGDKGCYEIIPEHVLLKG